MATAPIRGRRTRHLKVDGSTASGGRETAGWPDILLHGIQRATVSQRYIPQTTIMCSTRASTSPHVVFALPRRAERKDPTAGWHRDAHKVREWERWAPGAPGFQILSRACRDPACLSRTYSPPPPGTLSAAPVLPPAARDRRDDRRGYKSQPAARLVPRIAIPVFPAKGSAFRNWR